MALNFPTSPTDLQQYTDPNDVVWEYSATKGVWNKLRVDTERQFSGGKIYFTSTKFLSSTLLGVDFDANEFDIGNYTNISVYPKRLTVNRTGYYRIYLLAVTGTEGTGASYTFSLRKNGSITLTSGTAGPNQFVTFDEVYILNDGDYIELYASEASATGTLTTDSFFQINRLGFAVGSSFSAQTAFSGVKTELSTGFNLSSTPAALQWDTTEYNLNADILGNVYWENTSPETITIKTTGYYRITGQFYADTVGSDDTYLVDLKIAGATYHSASFSANEILDIDETLELGQNNTIEIYVSNSDSVGTITNNSYLSVIREGV